ncbi:hypothetical protein F4860DRAFT_207862 [Xylaria cubensis]|nr:hypothetical protein F4860DRAFT_207862 [Xylaria cubensis]
MPLDTDPYLHVGLGSMFLLYLVSHSTYCLLTCLRCMCLLNLTFYEHIPAEARGYACHCYHYVIKLALSLDGRRWVLCCCPVQMAPYNLKCVSEQLVISVSDQTIYGYLLSDRHTESVTNTDSPPPELAACSSHQSLSLAPSSSRRLGGDLSKGAA